MSPPAVGEAGDGEPSIRRFVPADLDAVVALWNQIFGYPEPRNEPERVVAAKLAVDDRLLVAVDGERVVGTAMFGYDGHRGWLYRVAVAESARLMTAPRPGEAAGPALADAIETFNENFLKLNARLFTFMDYAVIART